MTIEYDKNQPIYQRGAETTGGYHLGGGHPCDYTGHPAVPNPLDLCEGMEARDGLYHYPNGVILPLPFWDARDDTSCGEPKGGYGWQHWPERGIIKTRFHQGTDHPGSEGVAIRSTMDGVVICADDYSDKDYSRTIYGKGVMIYHGRIWREDWQYNIFTLYAHCSLVTAKIKNRVQAGQRIAKVGNTGHSYGNHLHYAIKITKDSASVRESIDLDSAAGPWQHSLDPRITDLREVEPC